MKAWQSHIAASILYVTVASSVVAVFLVLGTLKMVESAAWRDG
jgi:hypothetical protein